MLQKDREELTLRYWKASLAWKNIGEWAKGWTQGAFIKELQELCEDNGNIGSRADVLLDMMIKDVERCPLDCPGEVVELKAARLKSLVNKSKHKSEGAVSPAAAII